MEDGQQPLTALARGFRKRTLVTARLMARIGLDMVKKNRGAGQVAEDVDEEDAVAAARELLDQLDGLKGLTMKLGQMLSYLDTSMPPKARRVLARLQAASRPVEAEAIAQVVRAELGAAPEALFDRFEPMPFAAASIGQVHRATLDGRAWAVKIQYPGVEELLRADVATVGRLARLATLLSPVDGRGLVDELAARVLEECDYDKEARSQIRFRGLFAGHPDLVVPEVLTARSGRRVLTTALSDGAGFDEFAATAPAEARDRAAAAIFEACFTSIFQHGIYNADPHPGNYRFGPDGRVTLLDFGCVKEFAPGFVAGWKRIARALLADDRAAFRRAWTDAGFVGRARRFDFDHQYEAMRVLYRAVLTDEPFRFTDAFIAEVHDRLAFQNVNKLRLALPPDWLFVNRLQFGLFSVLAHLGATVRYGRIYRAALG
jgi:predicted unusual protein kinase regulating ubiquinone biosynthesis (AarF/ABC1/UbiB family)